jgi:hypothetical protein
MALNATLNESVTPNTLTVVSDRRKNLVMPSLTYLRRTPGSGFP